jgi:hypothetical protein
MSCTGSMPKLTRASEIPMTSCDSHLASAACSSLILSMHARVVSSPNDKSRPLVGCRLHSCSSASIASHTSRSISYRQRRILHSSNVRVRSVSCLDLEPEARTWVKKSRSTTSAQT